MPGQLDQDVVQIELARSDFTLMQHALDAIAQRFGPVGGRAAVDQAVQRGAQGKARARKRQRQRGGGDKEEEEGEGNLHLRASGWWSRTSVLRWSSRTWV